MPKELDELHKKVMENLKGKTNPRTNKPYSEEEIWAVAQSQHKKMQGKEFHFSEFSKINFKEEEGEFYSQGFVATTHPDRAAEKDRKGDILTKNAISSIVEQINSRKGLMADLASYRHDWVKDKDPNLPPVGRAVKAEVRQLPDGHYGAWIETHHSKTHPNFDSIKYEVENGYLPGYSIEYEAKKSNDVLLPQGKFRMIDDLDIMGYGLANGRLIANTQAIIEGTMYKEIYQLKEGNKMENIKELPDSVITEKVSTKEMSEQVSVEVKEYERFKKFLDMEAKELQKESLRAMVKEALSSVMPEMKVRLNDSMDFKGIASSVEYKEWKEIVSNNVSAKEAMRRATKLATKTGAFDRWWTGTSHNVANRISWEPAGRNGEKIQIKEIELKALQVGTNQSADTDYLQNAAELSDIYSPAITLMINQEVNYWNLLPKEDFSGREAISWRAENVANASAAAVAEGAAVNRGETTRQKLREEFKYYNIGFQVTGQMIEAAKSGIGDVFQAEVEAGTRRLLDLMDTDLFAENGAFADLPFLGLEYISDSAGNATLYGLARAAGNLLGNAGSNYSAQAGAAISKATLRTAIRTLEIEGASTARSSFVFVCHPLQRDMILALLDDAQRFLSTSARAGFEGQPSFDGVPIFVDANANTDDIFLCNFGRNGLRMGVQVPVRFEDLAKVDDSRSGFLKFYGNQYALAPRQAVYMIQGLATA